MDALFTRFETTEQLTIEADMSVVLMCMKQVIEVVLMAGIVAQLVVSLMRFHLVEMTGVIVIVSIEDFSYKVIGSFTKN